MMKNILRLLAASASFVALLLITNPAIASTSFTNTANQFSSPVSLNVISPTLQSVGNGDRLANHLGCSCAACLQGITQTNS